MFMNIEFMFLSCILHLYGMNLTTVETAELQNIFHLLLSYENNNIAYFDYSIRVIGRHHVKGFINAFIDNG